jgi:branched-chain amino acid transport system ATP-binding protein
VTSESAPTPVRMLDVHGLSFSFGGVAALSDVDLHVNVGECVGLIGPNGAGKSTLLNCISRLNDLRVGSIFIAGYDCTRTRTAELIQRGVKRTFQNIETFNDMEVREVLTVGAHHLTKTSLWEAALGLRRVHTEAERTAAEVERIAQSLGIERYLSDLVRSLPYGVQKKVDLARALIGETTLLLLDEPAAGLSEWEWHEMVDILLALKSGGQVGIVIVEHQLSFVRQIVDRLYVLDAGRVLVEGPPQQVLQDQRVIDAYIGSAII